MIGLSTPAQQAYAAACLLPEIELYKKAIAQANETIKNSRDAIIRIDQSVSQVNPQFFTEYLEGQTPLRTKIEKHLGDVKSYAHIKSLKSRLDWFTPQLETLLNTFNNNHEKLGQDTNAIRVAEQKLVEKTPAALEYRSRLEPMLVMAQEKERQFHLVDHDQLAEYEKEIKRQRNVLHSFKGKLDQLDQNEITLLEKDASLTQETKDLEEVNFSLLCAILSVYHTDHLFFLLDN